jgi:hypothetical protein
MKCSHCASNLQDTATTCPNCGANVQQEQQDTQQHPQAFSYLPEGTPPWPTTIPEHHHNHVTQAQFANNHDSQSTFTNPPSSAKQRRGGLLTILSILVLMPLLGSLITLGLLYAHGQFTPKPAANPMEMLSMYSNPTPDANNATPGTAQATSTGTATETSTPDHTNNQSSPVATLPATTNVKTYTNKDINMSLQYPSDWSLGQISSENSAARTLPIQPPQSYGMQIYIEHLTDAFSAFFTDASELNRRNIQSLFQIQNAHDIQKISSPNTHPTIAGTTWDQADATLQVGTSQKLHFTTISVEHNGSYYSIYFLMPDAIYQDAMQKYMQPLLASLQFSS